MKIEDLLIPDYDTSNLVIAYPDGADPIVKIIAPEMPASKRFEYLSFAKGNFRFVEKTDRAIGDMNVKYLKIEGGVWTEAFLVEHPLAVPLDRQLQGREGVIKDIAQSDTVEAGRDIFSALSQEHCTKVIGEVIALGSVSGHYVVPTTKWDATGAEPGKDIAAAGKAFFANCGLKPTHIVFPWTVVTAMSDFLRAEYNINQNITDMAVLERVCTDKLGIPAGNILIAAKGVYNGTTYAEEWGDNVLLCYTKAQPTKRDLTFMKTFRAKDRPSYLQYAPYVANQQTGVEVQGQMEYLIKTVCQDAGYLIKDVLS
jgi:hypothetical protein